MVTTTLIAPMIDELAAENAGSARIAKVNIDDSMGTAAKYGISTIPALLLFTLFGGSGVGVDTARAAELLAETASPEGLALLAPFIMIRK